MPLADHKPDEKKFPGPPCSMASLLANLDDEDRDWLLNELSRDRHDREYMTHADIATTLRNAGHPLSRFQVMWHRNRNCRCAA